tara:strand:+ start:1313 stop:1648 length:336 start_codon:yes stop_codon:yes gene_type:complete
MSDYVVLQFQGGGPSEATMIDVTDAYPGVGEKKGDRISEKSNKHRPYSNWLSGRYEGGAQPKDIFGSDWNSNTYEYEQGPTIYIVVAGEKNSRRRRFTRIKGTGSHNPRGN